MIELGAKESDIVEILDEQEGLGDKEILIKLARKILSTPPKQGYLTISNAFQWRIKYNQIFKLKNSFGGIYTNEKYNEKELSEYQTPLFFTDTVCDYLKKLEINPTIIIDPTCGIGNFLKSAARVFHYKQIYGIEIDKEKLNLVDNSIKNINLINEDIFKFNFNMINKNDSYLILGNLPWSANVKISELNSKNIKTDTPYINIPKTNNFDISKEIILKIIDEFKNTKTTIAFICKRKVSKKVFKEVIKNNISYNFVKQINFSYSKYFKLEDEACLFILQFGKND
jgi:16S rRNA A1518/A1519 N6-dimethyltransferase RsmA/KsgA/DIM1 with predicted DNA glycosylase/AP lyase activity